MNRQLSLTLVGVAAAVSAALATDPPQAPTAMVQAATPLPRLPAVPAMAEHLDGLAQLSTTTMWGPRPPTGAAAAAAATPPAPPEPRWRVAGTLWRQGQWQVVLRDEGGRAPTQLLSIGDTLPAGERIVDVRRDGVRVATVAPPRRKRPAAVTERWIDIPRRSLAP